MSHRMKLGCLNQHATYISHFLLVASESGTKMLFLQLLGTLESINFYQGPIYPLIIMLGTNLIVYSFCLCSFAALYMLPKILNVPCKAQNNEKHGPACSPIVWIVHLLVLAKWVGPPQPAKSRARWDRPN